MSKLEFNAGKMLTYLNKIDENKSEERVQVLYDIGRFYFILGNFKDSAIQYEQALKIYESLEDDKIDTEMLVKLWINILNNYLILKEYGKAQVIVDKVDIFPDGNKKGKTRGKMTMKGKDGEMMNMMLLLIRLASSMGICAFK